MTYCNAKTTANRMRTPFSNSQVKSLQSQTRAAKRGDLCSRLHGMLALLRGTHLHEHLLQQLCFELEHARCKVRHVLFHVILVRMQRPKRSVMGVGR